MIGQPPVDISLPVDVIVKLIKIILRQEASGIGLSSPFLVDRIVNPDIGVHCLQLVIKNTESLHIGAHVHVEIAGVHIPPRSSGVDFIAENPVVNLSVSGLSGIALPQKSAHRLQMLHAAALLHIQRIAGTFRAAPRQRMDQVVRSRVAALVQKHHGHLHTLIVKAFHHLVVVGNPPIAEIVSLSVVSERNRSRLSGRRANFIQINIVNDLLHAKLLKLPACNGGNLRQNAFDSPGHASRSKRRDCLRICDVMLVADLNHLSAALHRHQKFPA